MMRSNETYDPDTFNFRPGASSSVDFKCPADLIPNKFYYACPENLIDVKDIPAYAGLIYVVDQYRSYEVKPAPFLHKNKKDHTGALLQKFYHKCLNDRRELFISLQSMRYGTGDDNLTAYQKEIIENLKSKYL